MIGWRPSRVCDELLGDFSGDLFSGGDVCEGL